MMDDRQDDDWRQCGGWAPVRSPVLPIFVLKRQIDGHTQDAGISLRNHALALWWADKLNAIGTESVEVKRETTPASAG